jgi:hypothetical protein
MSGDGFKKMLDASPFRPFLIRYGSGREIPVRHPELVTLSPGGRTAIVWRPDESAESFEILDVLLIESVEPMNGSRNRKD